MTTSQTETSAEEIKIRAILRQLREKVDSWEEDDSLEEVKMASCKNLTQLSG